MYIGIHLSIFMGGSHMTWPATLCGGFGTHPLSEQYGEMIPSPNFLQRVGSWKPSSTFLIDLQFPRRAPVGSNLQLHRVLYCHRNKNLFLSFTKNSTILSNEQNLAPPRQIKAVDRTRRVFDLTFEIDGGCVPFYRRHRCFFAFIGASNESSSSSAVSYFRNPLIHRKASW
jgi:hypothetical protein